MSQFMISIPCFSPELIPRFHQDADHTVKFFPDNSGYHEDLDTLEPSQIRCKLYAYTSKHHNVVSGLIITNNDTPEFLIPSSILQISKHNCKECIKIY